MKKNRGDEPIRVVIHIYMKYHKETPRVPLSQTSKDVKKIKNNKLTTY
jgi:phage-related protein